MSERTLKAIEERERRTRGEPEPRPSKKAKEQPAEEPPSDTEDGSDGDG